MVEVRSPERGVVNFFERADVNGQAVFRWPRRPDKCLISADTVFEKGIVLEASSSSGRAFKVLSQHLEEKYLIFKAQLYSTSSL